MEKKSRCSLVVTVTRLPAERPWFDSVHGRALSPFSNVQIFSDSNLTTCLKRAECPLPGVKRPGHEVDHVKFIKAVKTSLWRYLYIKNNVSIMSNNLKSRLYVKGDLGLD